MSVNLGQVWSEVEDQLVARGLPLRQLADELGRTYASVRRRRRELREKGIEVQVPPMELRHANRPRGPIRASGEHCGDHRTFSAGCEDCRARARMTRRKQRAADPELARARDREKYANYVATHGIHPKQAQSRAQSSEQRARNRASHCRHTSKADATAHQKGKPWTPEEDAILARGELTTLQQALLTHRTYSAVRQRRKKLGLARRVA